VGDGRTDTADPYVHVKDRGRERGRRTERERERDTHTCENARGTRIHTTPPAHYSVPQVPEDDDDPSAPDHFNLFFDSEPILSLDPYSTALGSPGTQDMVYPGVVLLPPPHTPSPSLSNSSLRLSPSLCLSRPADGFVIRTWGCVWVWKKGTFAGTVEYAEARVPGGRGRSGRGCLCVSSLSLSLFVGSLYVSLSVALSRCVGVCGGVRVWQREVCTCTHEVRRITRTHRMDEVRQRTTVGLGVFCLSVFLTQAAGHLLSLGLCVSLSVCVSLSLPG